RSCARSGRSGIVPGSGGGREAAGGVVPTQAVLAGVVAHEVHDLRPIHGLQFTAQGGEGAGVHAVTSRAVTDAVKGWQCSQRRTYSRPLSGLVMVGGGAWLSPPPCGRPATAAGVVAGAAMACRHCATRSGRAPVLS